MMPIIVKGCQQKVDLDKIELQEDHKAILKEGTYQALKRGKEEGNLDIISIQSTWGLFAFTDIADAVFKFRPRHFSWRGNEVFTGQFFLDQGQAEKSTVDWLGDHMVSAQKGKELCEQHNLYCLHVPPTRLLPVDDNGSMIVEERFDCPWPTWQEQEKIYHYIQTDPELREYAIEVLKQLIFFTVVSGEGNTKYDKLQILPNGKVALHDLGLTRQSYYRGKNEPEFAPRTYGLYASSCYEENGIFDHILPAYKEELKQYALEVVQQHCPDQYENVLRRLR